MKKLYEGMVLATPLLLAFAAGASIAQIGHWNLLIFGVAVMAQIRLEDIIEQRKK